LKGEINLIKITELKTNEGAIHYYNKKYLYDWILKKDIIFHDQYGNEFTIDIDNMQFSSMESYVYEDILKESGSPECYHGGCCGFLCINFKSNYIPKRFKYNKKLTNRIVKVKYYELYFDKINDKLCDRKFILNNKWKKNIIVNHSENIIPHNAFFKIHPCNFCKYKGIANCILIFDIAFARKGQIEVAVEVENTSPVKWNKLNFCKQNNITLIEVKAKDIIRSNFVNSIDKKHVYCEVLNMYGGINHIQKYIYAKEFQVGIKFINIETNQIWEVKLINDELKFKEQYFGYLTDYLEEGRFKTWDGDYIKYANNFQIGKQFKNININQVWEVIGFNGGQMFENQIYGDISYSLKNDDDNYFEEL